MNAHEKRREWEQGVAVESGRERRSVAYAHVEVRASTDMIAPLGLQAEHFARAKKVLAAEVQRLRSQVGEAAK